MVDRGLEFLETAAEDDRLGGQCLMGLVFFKEGKGEGHLQIDRAVRQCKSACRRGANQVAEDIYSTGLAIIFLAELNAEKYQPEINQLLAYLQIRQKPGGGWGYPLAHPRYGKTGDTSMTQYAVLALWTARQHGIRVSDDMVLRVCNWLLRTQDPSGAWAYQGQDPGPGDFRRVEQQQSDIRPSICAAGLGSTYICGDMLGLKVSARPRRRVRRSRDAQQPQPREQPLPPALKLVTSASGDNGRRKPIRAAGRVSIEQWQRAIADGKRWFRKNYTIDPPMWPYYYLYALERYESFRELAEEQSDRDHNWYDDGVRQLARKQQEDGSWVSLGGAEVNTAFAVLFLTRSTQRSIQRTGYGEGRLTGGRGLPTNVANVQVKKGRIVATPLGGSVADALAVLEDPTSPNYDFVSQMGADLKLNGDSSVRRGQMARLRRIIRGGSYKARAAAVRLLARQRNLDDVPLLILALEDPDPGVRRAADQGLRFMSRRLDGVPSASGSGNAQVRAARVEAWKQWYRSIRPDAQFLEPR